MIRPVLLALFALLAITPAANAHRIKTKTLQIDHPWTGDMAEAKPPFDIVVQMVIRNTGKAADVLTGASSPHAERIELVHAATGPQKAVEIKAGARVELSTKSVYLRVFGFNKLIDTYDYFPMTLNFKRAGAVKIEVMVEDVAIDLPKLIN
jgi:copper(I)-binding protein